MEVKGQRVKGATIAGDGVGSRLQMLLLRVRGRATMTTPTTMLLMVVMMMMVIVVV